MLENSFKLKGKMLKNIKKFFKEFPNFHLYLLIFVYLHGAYTHLQINEINWVFAYCCGVLLIICALIFMKFSEIKWRNKRIELKLEHEKLRVDILTLMIDEKDKERGFC